MKKTVVAITVIVVALMAGTALGTTADMLAGNPKNGANVVGTVTVTDDGTNLTVTYLITDSNCVLTETHLHVATDPGDFPQTKKGNAIPGLFDHGASNDVSEGVTTVTYVIPLPEGAPPVYVAAHAVVACVVECPELVLELPEEVTVSVLWVGDGADDDSYFDALVADTGLLDGVFDAWCVDTDRSIRPPGYVYRETPMQAIVYSSYDCDLLPDIIEPLVENCENMDLVNWVLNNIAVGDLVDNGGSPCNGEAYTYGDIQRAIWELVDDTLSDSGLGDWSQCRVDEIIALAEANGEGYVPDCGEVAGVILLPYVYMFDGVVLVVPGTADTAWPGYPGDPRYDLTPEEEAEAELVYVQPIILTVPAPCCYGEDTAWAGVEGDEPDGDGDGYRDEFPGKDWSMYFEHEVVD